MAPAAAGGGWDTTARAFQGSSRGAKLDDGIEVFNVEGAGGTLGLSAARLQGLRRPVRADDDRARDARRDRDQRLRRAALAHDADRHADHRDRGDRRPGQLEVPVVQGPRGGPEGRPGARPLGGRLGGRDRPAPRRASSRACSASIRARPSTSRTPAAARPTRRSSRAPSTRASPGCASSSTRSRRARCGCSRCPRRSRRRSTASSRRRSRSRASTSSSRTGACWSRRPGSPTASASAITGWWRRCCRLAGVDGERRALRLDAVRQDRRRARRLRGARGAAGAGGGRRPRDRQVTGARAFGVVLLAAGVIAFVATLGVGDGWAASGPRLGPGRLLGAADGAAVRVPAAARATTWRAHRGGRARARTGRRRRCWSACCWATRCCWSRSATRSRRRSSSG